jgi:RPA family protein
MKKILFLLLLIISAKAFAQDTIKTAQAKANIDNLMCVTGKVVSYKLATEGKSTNYINLDVAYPDNVFTVVLTNDYLSTLKFKIEDLKDKTIFVFGKITTYKNDPKQIPQIFNPRWIDIKKE